MIVMQGKERQLTNLTLRVNWYANSGHKRETPTNDQFPGAGKMVGRRAGGLDLMVFARDVAEFNRGGLA